MAFSNRDKAVGARAATGVKVQCDPVGNGGRNGGEHLQGTSAMALGRPSSPW